MPSALILGLNGVNQMTPADLAMKDTIAMTERERFERWARPDSVQRQRHPDTGEYTDRGMSASWAGWQAACDSMCAAIKAADDEANDGDYMLSSDDCISVIRGTWKG